MRSRPFGTTLSGEIGYTEVFNKKLNDVHICPRQLYQIMVQNSYDFDRIIDELSLYK